MMRRLPVTLACLLGVLLLAESVHAPRTGSPDAYQYLDVTANLAAGLGLVQSVPGYNSPRFPAEPRWPAPFTSQPPGYPWLASQLVRAGMEPTRALCALSSAGLALTWLVGAALAAVLWGAEAGMLALLGLALTAVSGTLTNRIWSDPLGIALALASLFALLRGTRPGAAALRWALLSGVLAAAACLNRYVLGLLIPFGALWWIGTGRSGERWRPALLHATSGALIVLPLLIRNRALAGGWFGEPRNPSTQALGGFMANAIHMTWGRLPAALQLALVLGVPALAFATWRSRARRERTLEALAAGGGLLPLWGLLYAIVLLALRLQIHFDDVGVRLLAPSLVAGALTLAGLAARWLSLPRAVLAGAASLGLVLALGLVGQRVSSSMRAPVHRERSAFLTWLAAEAAPGTVVVAEDAVDLAWEFRHEPGPPRRFLSFSPAPYMRPLEHDDLRRLAALIVRPEGPPLRIIVRGEAADSSDWRARYGDLVASAIAGRVPAGEGLVLEQVVSGRHVLRWQGAGATLP